MSTSSGAQTHSESSVDGSLEKASNPTPPCQALAVDQTWQASQGITFSTVAQNNQAWQPSLGISFSLCNPVSRQPYSTSSASTPAATSPMKATHISSPMESHSRDRYVPIPRPYQPSKSPRALGSDLFSSGAAAEEDLVMDDDEDLGELLERASREQNQPANTILVSTSETMDTMTDPAKLDHDVVSPEPLTVTPIKPCTRIETRALKASKGSATFSSTQSLLTYAPERKTLPVQTSNLRVDAVNVIGIPKPRDARPRNQSESPSPASSAQRPSESEIERLAQIPNRPTTARNESQRLVSSDDTVHSAKGTNLELMYVHGERMKHGCYSIMDQLRDLHAFYLSHPTYYPTLLDPIEIQDLLDEFNELSVDMEHEYHGLRFFMWRIQELKLTLSERGTLRGSAIERRLRLTYLLQPFLEHRVGQMRLRRAFGIYDRYCQRRGPEFLTKSLVSIKWRPVFVKGKTWSLRTLVAYCTNFWQEIDDYEELTRRAFESDVWLHHARDLGSSWRRTVQAVRGAKEVMKETPRALVRLNQFARAFKPLYVSYRVMESALRDAENTHPAKSQFGSSIATTTPDLHDELDYPSDPVSTASASELVAAEGQEDVRSRSRMANSQTSVKPERRSHKLSEKAAGNAKAVLRQSTAQIESPIDLTITGAAQGPPIECSGNLVSLSQNGQNSGGFRDNNLVDFVLRDRVKNSGTRVLLAIIELLEFSKEQSDHGRRTLTNLLDLQDMKEEWQIIQDRLSAAMHHHRAMARIRRDCWTQPKAKLDRSAFPIKLGAAEASADVDAVPAFLPDLNHKLPVALQTWHAGTPESSGKSVLRSKRLPKSHKRSDGLYEPTQTRQVVEKGSPENDFAQTNLPRHCGSSPGTFERSEAIRYVKGSLKQQVNPERILSQSTSSALQSGRAVQRRSVSHTRVTKPANVKSSPIQKRTIHCSALYGPSTEVESELPSTLLGPSKEISFSPLSYRIKDTDFEGASRPDSNTKLLHWEYTLYRGPLGEKVKVHYCKTKADTERIARLFFDEEVLGFDIEWKPSATAKEGIKKNVALIQIASEERIALFHIARFRGEDTVDDLVTPTFKYIMQTPRITKVGVSIKADCTRLRRYLGIESRGLFELSHLYKLVKYSPSNASSVDKRLVRLAAQVEEHLGLPLWKGQDVRGSDWSSADLNYQQVQYAASDSYAGFQLYHTLEHKRLALDPTPPRPYHAELNLPIRLSSGVSIPTDDEQTDLEDDSPTTHDPTNPPSIEELAHDLLNLKLKPPRPPHAKPPGKPPPKPPTPEYTTAQTWATTYRASLPSPHKPTASPASLRAYALWHEQKHTVPEAAALLRDPPLQNATVAVYVLEALKLEKLPFERARLEDVLGYVPIGGRGRYKGFLGGVGAELD